MNASPEAAIDTLHAILAEHGIPSRIDERLTADLIAWGAGVVRARLAQDEGWKDRLVDLLMARRHGASGAPIYVDPVIIRGLINDALAGKTARVDKRADQ